MSGKTHDALPPITVESGRKWSSCKLNPSCRGLLSTSMIELIGIDCLIVTPRDSWLKSPLFWLAGLVLDRLATYLQLTLEITSGHLQRSLAASSWKSHMHYVCCEITCTKLHTCRNKLSQQISTGCIMSHKPWAWDLKANAPKLSVQQYVEQLICWKPQHQRKSSWPLLLHTLPWGGWVATSSHKKDIKNKPAQHTKTMLKHTYII